MNSSNFTARMAFLKLELNGLATLDLAEMWIFVEIGVKREEIRFLQRNVWRPTATRNAVDILVKNAFFFIFNFSQTSHFC